ncbi:MAG: hypothetical protein ACOC1G_04880 [Phycisphaeraceae bacterium]
MMSKLRMIEQIRMHNRSARTDFLTHFDEAALKQYLARLTHLHGRRGPTSVWVRESQNPAVVTRTAA